MIGRGAVIAVAAAACLGATTARAADNGIWIEHRLHDDAAEIDAIRQSLVAEYDMNAFEDFGFVTVEADPYARCYFTTPRNRLHPSYVCRKIVPRNGAVDLSYFAGTALKEEDARDAYRSFAQSQVGVWEDSLPLLRRTYGLPDVVHRK